MRTELPDRNEPLVDDEKKITLPWQAFLEGVSSGDLGTTFTPTFVGLTEVGTAVKTGIYYRISDRLAYFRIIITPATSTSATLGTTYCDNFPLTIIANGSTMSVSGFTAAPAGVVAANKRIYTATWSAITTPITIVGTIEVT